MKNKSILPLALIIALLTTTFIFANDVEIIEKNGQQYIPLKRLISNLGGEIKENKSELNVIIKTQQIKIDNKYSFAKVNETYYPLENKKINGFSVPVDKKPLVQNKDIYISNEFFKNINISEFKVKNGKLIISNGSSKIQSKGNKNNRDENKEVIIQTNTYEESNRKTGLKSNNTQIINRHNNNNKIEEKIENNNIEQETTKDNNKSEGMEESKSSQVEIPRDEPNNTEIAE